MAGRVFSGRVHPTEIAQRMVREADLSTIEHLTGPMVPNRITVSINPNDLDLPPDSLSRVLAEAYEAHAAEQGWRLPGPTFVNIKLDPDLPVGAIECELEVRKGMRHPGAHRQADVGPVQQPGGWADPTNATCPAL